MLVVSEQTGNLLEAIEFSNVVDSNIKIQDPGFGSMLKIAHWKTL